MELPDYIIYPPSHRTADSVGSNTKKVLVREGLVVKITIAIVGSELFLSTRPSRSV